MSWKPAQVVPIFKKGSASDPSNYRSISLTSTVCKILESIVKDSVLEHLTVNNLISFEQYGFLSKRSATTQLIDCVSDWTNNSSSRLQTDISYLDFAKALDSVVHSKLLYKLESYGLCGLTIEWIKCFLTDRVQKVRVGSCLSNSESVVCLKLAS